MTHGHDIWEEALEDVDVDLDDSENGDNGGKQRNRRNAGGDDNNSDGCLSWILTVVVLLAIGVTINTIFPKIDILRGVFLSIGVCCSVGVVIVIGAAIWGYIETI